MDRLIARRADFGDAVMNYINEVDNETEQIVLDLVTKMDEIFDDFEADVNLDVADSMTGTVDSTINHLEAIFNEY